MTTSLTHYEITFETVLYDGKDSNTDYGRVVTEGEFAPNTVLVTEETPMPEGWLEGRVPPPESTTALVAAGVMADELTKWENVSPLYSNRRYNANWGSLQPCGEIVRRGNAGHIYWATHPNWDDDSFPGREVWVGKRARLNVLFPANNALHWIANYTPHAWHVHVMMAWLLDEITTVTFDAADVFRVYRTGDEATANTIMNYMLSM